MPLYMLLSAALAVFLVGIRRPARALPLFAFLAMITPVQAYVDLGWPLPIITVHRALVVALLLVYVLAGRQAVSSEEPVPFVRVMVAVAALLLVSSLFSVNMGLSLKKWVGVVLESYLLYFVFTRLTRRREDINAALLAIVAAVGLAAAIGLVQAYTHWSPVDYLPPPSRELLDYELRFDPARGLRPLSVFPHPILLGSGIVMAWPLLLVAINAAGRRSTRLLLASLLPVMGLCLYKTMSRGAWLAGVVAALVLLRFGSPGVRRLVVACTLVCVVGLAFSPAVWDNLARQYRDTLNIRSQLGYNFQYRLEMWNVAVAALSRDVGRALFGYGYVAFRELGFSSYFAGRWRTYTSCDNSWAGLAIQGGILGLSGVVALLSSLVALILRGLRSAAGPPDRDVFAAVLASVAALLFMMTNVAIYGWAQFGYLLWMLAAVAAALRRLQPAEAPDRAAAPTRPPVWKPACLPGPEFLPAKGRP